MWRVSKVFSPTVWLTVKVKWLCEFVSCGLWRHQKGDLALSTRASRREVAAPCSLCRGNSTTVEFPGFSGLCVRVLVLQSETVCGFQQSPARRAKKRSWSKRAGFWWDVQLWADKERNHNRMPHAYVSRGVTDEGQHFFSSYCAKFPSSGRSEVGELRTLVVYSHVNSLADSAQVLTSVCVCVCFPSFSESTKITFFPPSLYCIYLLFCSIVFVWVNGEGFLNAFWWHRSVIAWQWIYRNSTIAIFTAIIL